MGFTLSEVGTPLPWDSIWFQAPGALAYAGAPQVEPTLVITTVPEPGTFVLAGLSVVFGFGMRWRERRCAT